MPRGRGGDAGLPRRRRGSAVAVVPRRGLLLRILCRSPKDTAAGLIAVVVSSAIVANALFLQRGPHPAPMFGGPATVLASGPLPRSRPAQGDWTSPEEKAAEQRLSDSKLLDPRPVAQRSMEPRSAEARGGEPKAAEPKAADPKASEPKVSELKASDPLTDLVKATASVAPESVPRPPASIPGPITSARRVAAVQRALTEYGYGQLKPTGMAGPDTKAAIEKFEHERKLPVTGQLSERVVNELAAAIGRPIE